MSVPRQVGVALGSMATLAVLVLIFVGRPIAMAQDRDRDGASQDRTPREGGIPCRELGAARDRDRQEGTEEGVPDASVQPRLKEFGPRIVPPRSDWRLGVWVYNTETGVVITRVQRGSAAEREGLERGDRIVTVGGYQIGFVEDYLYPLGYELQRQADRRGNVALLVQNVRTDKLMSMRVRLDGRDRIRNEPAEQPEERLPPRRDR